jgi:hypothetical protein
MCRIVVLSLVLAAVSPVRADDPLSNRLTDEEIADGWLLVFDGMTASEWKIEGDHEIRDGTLIIGGKQATRATLKTRVHRGFEIRFQYRTEGKDKPGVAWDWWKEGSFIPGLALPMPPTKEWREFFVQDYYDIRYPFQRVVKHSQGANGVFGPVESVWLEVPAGNRLFLRNVRLRQERTSLWPWAFVAAAFLCGGLMMVVVWRWKKRRHKGPPPSSGSYQRFLGLAALPGLFVTVPLGLR